MAEFAVSQENPKRFFHFLRSFVLKGEYKTRQVDGIGGAYYAHIHKDGRGREREGK